MPSLPLARALAVAGEWVVGGIGTHETALASPETVDLGGRCVVPGLNDAHVHFPTWALAQSEVRLEGTRSLEEAVARVGDAVGGVRPGGWLRGRGWRSADWSPAVEPTREALDPVTGPIPTILTARDSHSCWLNSAALALADGDLAVPGGVVELDARGEPTGVLREESCWHYRDVWAAPSLDEMVEASRVGVRLANTRGVTAIHDKDGWLGAFEVFQRLEAEGSLSLRVWQSLPHERVGELAELGLRSGFGSPLLRLGYLKAFMDGTLGSQTARLLDGSGVEITSRAAVGGDRARGGTRRLPRRGARDRRPGQPRGARCLRGDAAGLGAARPAPAHRARAAARAGGRRPLRLARGRDLGAVLACARPTETWPSGSGPGSSTAPTRSVRSGTAARSSRTAPTRRSRSSTRSPGSSPASCARSTTGRAGIRSRRSRSKRRCGPRPSTPAWLARDERRRGKLVPGHYADLVVLDRDPLACPPEELHEVRVVATMLAGRWVHNPPPWD